MRPGADPGFPVGGSANPTGGAPASGMGASRQKVCEKKRLGPVGGRQRYPPNEAISDLQSETKPTGHSHLSVSNTWII